MTTISFCIICKNEIKNIENLLRSVLPAVEQAVVVDTGSTDGTLEKLLALESEFSQLEVYQFEWIDDFSAARNFSFSKATQDWVFWLDGDDSVNLGALQKFKPSLADPSVDAWMLPYVYSRTGDGLPQTVLRRERFLRRSKAPKWIDPIHECVDVSYFRLRESDDLSVEHLRYQLGKPYDAQRNVRILKKCYESTTTPSPRITYYYGKELFGLIDPEAIPVLERFITMPGRYWDDEVNARAKLGLHYLSQKRHGDAIRVVNDIYHIDNTRKRAEFYYVYGMVEKDLRNFEQAIWWLLRCLEDAPAGPRVIDKEMYTWKPTKAIAECYAELAKSDIKQLEKAAFFADKVLAMLPSDLSIQAWHRSILRQMPIPSVPGGLTVLELGTYVRLDGIKCSHTHFADHSFDGVVAHPGTSRDVQQMEEVKRVVRPGGFVWITAQEHEMVPGLGCLGQAQYNGRTVSNFVAEDTSKPSFWFDGYDPYRLDDSAVVRLRIGNFARSAIKAGYPLCSTAPDFFVSTRLFKGSIGTTRVLELTEKLPNYDYFGIRYADVVNCSSPLLAEYVSSIVDPKTKVICVEDCFEAPNEFWL